MIVSLYWPDPFFGSGGVSCVHRMPLQAAVAEVLDWRRHGDDSAMVIVPDGADPVPFMRLVNWPVGLPAVREATRCQCGCEDQPVPTTGCYELCDLAEAHRELEAGA